jgi:hypothetical protein
MCFYGLTVLSVLDFVNAYFHQVPFLALESLKCRNEGMVNVGMTSWQNK